MNAEGDARPLSGARPPRIPLGTIFRIVAFGTLILIVCWISIEAPRLHGRVTPIWPANALALSLLLTLPRRRWPAWLAAAWLGNLAANLLSGDGVAVSIALSLCNLAEIGLAGLLLRHFVGTRLDLSRGRDLLQFSLLAGLAAPLVSATFATAIMGRLQDGDGLLNLGMWAAADGLGMLIVVPLLLTLRDMRGQAPPAIKPAGWLALAVLAVVTVTVFTLRQPVAFLIPPTLLLVIFQLEMAGAAWGSLLVIAVAVSFTLAGLGPMAAFQGSLAERVLVAQVFLAVITLTSFPTAAALAQRRRLQARVATVSTQVAEQYRRVKLAEEIAGVGYWRMEVATGKLTWSAAMFAAFGLEPGRAPDLDAAMARVHPEDRAQADRLMAHALEHREGYSNQTRLIWPDGQVRHVMGKTSCELDAAGAVAAVFGTMIDVTELKRAEAETAASEARYRMLADAATDVISRASLDGKMVYLSPAFTRLTGYEPSEFLGSSMFGSIHPDDLPDMIATYRAIIDGEHAEDVRTECRFRHKAGHWIWVEGSPSLIRDADGRPVAMVDVSRDATARKALEAELRAAREEAEAAAAVKGEFLANMSHELRTPLTSVLGFTRLALEQPDLTELSRGYIGKAANAGAALLATVNDVLDFSTLESGQLQIRPEPSDPVAICRDTLDLFSERAAAKGVALRFEAADLPPSLSLDPNRLRQLLLNLVGNAVKFSDAGEVALAVTWRAADQSLGVSVTDQGPGLSPEQQTLLFRRFSQVDGSSTRRHGGTGLGLAICRGLVEAMGGRIGVESQPGQGARFFFEIPAPPAAAGRAEELPDVPIFLPGTRVLVADDHAVNRELVRAVLAPLGAEITEAATGAEAVAAASRTPFDLILMDLRMPELDGMDAMRAIRDGDGPNCNVPILAFSADADESGAAARRQAGFDGDLAKPLLPTSLIAAVSRHTCGWEHDDVDELRAV